MTSTKGYSLRFEWLCELFLVYPLQAVGVHLGYVKKKSIKSYITTGGFIVIFLIITFKGNMNESGNNSPETKSFHLLRAHLSSVYKVSTLK